MSFITKSQGLWLILILFIIGIIGVFIINWEAGTVLAVLWVIFVAVKIYIDFSVQESKERHDKVIDMVGSRLDIISNKIGELIKQSRNNSVESVENRIRGLIAKERDAIRTDSEEKFRLLSGKILAVDNNMNRLERAIGAGLTDMNDKIDEMDKKIENKISKPFMVKPQKVEKDKLDNIFGE